LDWKSSGLSLASKEGRKVSWWAVSWS